MSTIAFPEKRRIDVYPAPSVPATQFVVQVDGELVAEFASYADARDFVLGAYNVEPYNRAIGDGDENILIVAA